MTHYYPKNPYASFLGTRDAKNRNRRNPGQAQIPLQPNLPTSTALQPPANGAPRKSSATLPTAS